MKTRIVGEGNFEKFKIEIDVDTREDLEYLWYIFNLGAKSLNETISICFDFESDKYRKTMLEKTNVWYILNSKKEKLINDRY